MDVDVYRQHRLKSFFSYLGKCLITLTLSVICNKLSAASFTFFANAEAALNRRWNSSGSVSASDSLPPPPSSSSFPPNEIESDAVNVVGVVEGAGVEAWIGGSISSKALRMSSKETESGAAIGFVSVGAKLNGLKL